MTLGISAFRKMMLDIMTMDAMTLGITTFNITLKICIQTNFSVMTLSKT